MDYCLSDGGRSQSRRPRQKNDCTVRALALVTGELYDRVYDTLAACGRKCSRRFHLGEWPQEGKAFGWSIRKISFPAIRGQRRMNPYTFAERYPHGRFIIRTAGHVAAVIDGVLYDTMPMRLDRCIYVAWEFMACADLTKDKLSLGA